MCHQNIRWFDVSVQDTQSVNMIDRATDLDEKFQPITKAKP
jgi:hypothetical protein